MSERFQLVKKQLLQQSRWCAAAFRVALISPKALYLEDSQNAKLNNTIPQIKYKTGARHFFPVRLVEKQPALCSTIFFFCFTTVMSYYYKAETCLVFLNKDREIKSVWPNHLLKIVLLGMVFYGSLASADLAWAFGDLGMGSMAWLNFVAILFLTKPAIKIKKSSNQEKIQKKSRRRTGLFVADF